MTRLWDKGEPLDALVLRYTAAEDPILDRRLVAYDVRASIAHGQVLQEAGYLTAAELESLRHALLELADLHAQGEWEILSQEEDVHTALENRLVERLGEPGKRLHLGRSRNDQVLAALRLYLLDAAKELEGFVSEVGAALAGLESRQGQIPLPGYTHLQRAMPSTVALWSSGFRAELADDGEGLRLARRRLDKNPLGSAAGYGVPILDLDRKRTTELLGFAMTHEPVTAVQLSRGKAEAGIAFELVLLMQDLGRLAADLCLFTTAEFGFVRLPDRFTTGSSIMPQKRNPDLFELVRGRAAQAPSELMSLLAITSKMPSGYHRDLQLLKAPLFRLIDQAADTLRLLVHVLPSIEFVENRCRAALDPSLFATEAAYRLVKEEGIPFRDAYREIARRLHQDGTDPEDC